MTRFRYKPEGPEARAWRKIALRVEKDGGTYGGEGLCAGMWKARVRRSVCASMSSRIQLFENNYLYYWPLTWNWDEDERGQPSDRITAAWLCYWMAREEGA